MFRAALPVCLLLAVCAMSATAAPEVGYGVGQVHPDFHLPLLDGDAPGERFLRLSDTQGKKRLLIVFASW